MVFNLFGRSFAFFSEARQWEKALALFGRALLSPFSLAALILLILCLKSAAGTGARRGRERLLPAYLFFLLSLYVLSRPAGAVGDFRFSFGYVLEGSGGFHETRVLLALLDFLLFLPLGGLLVRAGRGWGRYRASLLALTFGFLLEVLQFALGRGIGCVDHWLIFGSGGIAGVLLGSGAFASGKARGKRSGAGA